MSTSISTKLLQLGIVAFAVGTAQGQGVYTSALNSGGFINTITIGYTGYNTNCGGTSFWNALNGNYLSTWAPATLLDSTWAVQDVDYQWSYGFNFAVYVPPITGVWSGGCMSFVYSFFDLLSIHQTHFTGVPPIQQGGNCIYNLLACSYGTPKCTSGIGIPIFVPNCPSYIRSEFLVVGGVCTVSLDFSATGPGMCN
jgi:hypothetical protein